MEIQAVVAVARTGAVGRDGQVPWEYPEDFRQYKERVRGTPVVVGRSTFEMMDPIDDSENFVLTSDTTRTADHERVTFVNSRREAVERAAATGADTLSVIGGGGVYRTFLPFTDRAFVSELPEHLEGDADFPYLGAGWRVAERHSYDRFTLVEWVNEEPKPHSEL
ncbi:dihydrofolate reductase [Halobaculum sp. MBLA0147]|uniref:dihydrofolate reductase n=1 Tax=Halobaculum sp. MBLA0147 TaxID=3079934 RepID=UPI003526B8F8